jgi:hypothetical protein
VCDKFSFYQKLVNKTIKSDRSDWLKYINKNLRSHPQQFWTYISQHKKKNNDLTHLDVDGVFLNKSHDIAEAFSKHFKSVYNSNSSCSNIFSFVKHCTENLPLASISDSDVQNAIKWLRPTKSVGLGDIPSFVIKGCSDIFVPVLRFIFNFSLS